MISWFPLFLASTSNSATRLSGAYSVLTSLMMGSALVVFSATSTCPDLQAVKRLARARGVILILPLIFILFMLYFFCEFNQFCSCSIGFSKNGLPIPYLHSVGNVVLDEHLAIHVDVIQQGKQLADSRKPYCGLGHAAYHHLESKAPGLGDHSSGRS